MTFTVAPDAMARLAAVCPQSVWHEAFKPDTLNGWGEDVAPEVAGAQGLALGRREYQVVRRPSRDVFPKSFGDETWHADPPPRVALRCAPHEHAIY